MDDTAQAVLRLLVPQCGVLDTRSTSENSWSRAHVMLRMDLWWRKATRRRRTLTGSRTEKNESTNFLESWDDWGKADGHMELKRSSEARVEWTSERNSTNRAFKVVVDDVCRWFRADERTAEGWKRAVEMRLMSWNDMLMADLSDSKDPLLVSIGSSEREKNERDGIANGSKKVRPLRCISFLVKEIDAVFKSALAGQCDDTRLASGLKTANNFNDLLAAAPYAGYAFRVIGMGLDLATKLAEEEAVFGEAKGMFESLTAVLLQALLCAQESGDATGFDDFLRLVEKTEVAGRQIEQYCFSSKAGKVKAVLWRRPYRPSLLVKELAKMETALNLYLASGSYRGIARMLNAPGYIESHSLASTAFQSSLIKQNFCVVSHYEAIRPWPKMIPESDGGAYVGNSELLKQISDILSDTCYSTQGVQSFGIVQKCIVSGMGGIGKTELAKQYARGKMKYYNGGVYWVQAERNGSLIESFREIRDKISLFAGYRSGTNHLSRRGVASCKEEDEKELMGDCDLFFKRLGQDKGAWLVIFDNADDIEGGNDFRLQWLPRQGCGHVIITTRLHSRHREFKDFVKACSPMKEASTMDKLNTTDSRSLLLLRAGRHSTELNSKDEENINAIVGPNALDGHPLAIVQAGGYIGEQNVPFQEYWQQIDQYDVPKIIELQSGEEGKSILKTFLVSKSKLSRAAQELLSVLCWLPSDGVTESILWECVDGSLNAFEKSGIITWLGETEHHTKDQDALRKRMKGRQLVTEICKYRLIWRENRDGESFVCAHRLVYSVERAELENASKAVEDLQEGHDQCNIQLRDALLTAIMVLRRHEARQGGILSSVCDEIEQRETFKSAPKKDLYITIGELLQNYTDYNDAACMRFFQTAANLGHTSAMVTLGWMLECTKVVEKRKRDGVDWFRRAADLGRTCGRIYLGEMLENGRGLKKNERDAVEWFKKAADLGDADGMVSLGLMIANGKGVEKSEKDAIEWLRKAADRGNADGMVSLGLAFANGRGVEKSEKDAVQWSRNAADLGHTCGMSILGWMLENGNGVEKSERDAVEWYRKAADHGNAHGMVNLARMLENGNGVTRSERDAAEWYRKAADLGNAIGMIKMGKMLESGKGPEKSGRSAVEWYRKAAYLEKWGMVKSGMVILGDSHAKEKAVDKCRKIAYEQMLQASRLENSYACLNLGEFHVNGVGVTESAVEGARLWQKAAQTVAKGMTIWLKRNNTNEHGIQRRSGRDAVVWEELEAEGLSSSGLKPTFVILDRNHESNTLSGSWVPLSDNIDPIYDQCEHGEKERDAEKVFMLGLCYERGKGVDVNLEEAYELYMEAGVLGSLRALRRIFLDM